MTPPTQQNSVPATDERRWQFIRHADIYGAIGNKWVLELDARIDAELEEKKRLRTTLELLHSVQNGCPLPKYESDWNQAMRDTEKLIFTPDSAQPVEQKMCSHSHIDRDGTCQICGKFLPASNVNLANENTPPAEVPEWMVSAGKMIVQKLAINVPSLLVDAKVVDEFVACIFAHAPRPSASAVEGARAAASEIIERHLDNLQNIDLRLSVRAQLSDIILKHIATPPEREADANEAEEVHMTWIEAVERLAWAAVGAKGLLLQVDKSSEKAWNSWLFMRDSCVRILSTALAAFTKQDGSSNV